jgi:Zn finger protein HypA/HybF involved in hydrogenase expression
MHDLKYANEIIAMLKKGNFKNSKCSVIVNVTLSPFSHVKPEGLNETFKVLAEPEGYGHVKLNVKTGEFTMHCKNCKKASKHSEPVFECPMCKSSDFDIDKGKEFYIDFISSE